MYQARFLKKKTTTTKPCGFRANQTRTPIAGLLTDRGSKEIGFCQYICMTTSLDLQSFQYMGFGHSIYESRFGDSAVPAPLVGLLLSRCSFIFFLLAGLPFEMGW
jgi:hypothetical protein